MAGPSTHLSRTCEFTPSGCSGNRRFPPATGRASIRARPRVSPHRCRQRRGARCSAMATYRFRMIDRHGQLMGVHFLSLDSDADAKRYADTTLGEYDCERVEVWLGDNLICATIRRLS
jgi:hypothetical protein